MKPTLRRVSINPVYMGTVADPFPRGCFLSLPNLSSWVDIQWSVVREVFPSEIQSPVLSISFYMDKSISQLLEFSLLPVAKVLIMCVLGLLMASKYVNILPAKARKQLSKLVFSVFLPCLIFTKLGSAVTFQKMLEWWFIPVNVVLGAVLGCTLGLIVALIIQPPKDFFKFTIVFIGIGNIGNFPLVLLGAICHDKNNPFDDPDKCNTDGVAYISFGQWVGAVIVYTFVFQMLAPPSDYIESDKIESVELGIISVSAPLFSSPDADVNELVPKTIVQKIGGGIRSCPEFLRLKDILKPPVVASILALTVGSNPFLKNVFVEDSAVFYFLSDALNMLGGAMIPCIMLVLGGSLINGPGKSALDLKTTVTIVVVRLFLVPAIGLVVVFLADKLRLLPENDKMFRFVLLLQHSMPSSILAGAVASLVGFAEHEASAILFWEHIIAIVSMAGWLAVYMKLLF